MEKKEGERPHVRPLGKGEFLYILRGIFKDSEVSLSREKAEVRYSALYRGVYEAGRQSVMNCLSLN